MKEKSLKFILHFKKLLNFILFNEKIIYKRYKISVKFNSTVKNKNICFSRKNVKMLSFILSFLKFFQNNENTFSFERLLLKYDSFSKKSRKKIKQNNFFLKKNIVNQQLLKYINVKNIKFFKNYYNFSILVYLKKNIILLFLKLILRKKQVSLMKKKLLEKKSIQLDIKQKSDKEKVKKSIQVYLKLNRALASKKKNNVSFLNILQKVRFELFSNLLRRFDPIFFSYILQKFINRFTIFSKKVLAERIIFIAFFPIKVLTLIKPGFFFFSLIDSSKPLLTNIPKVLAGKVHIVPSFLYFDKQLKNAIKALNLLTKRRQDFQNINASLSHNVRSKKVIKLSMIFLRTHKIFYNALGKYTQRKNLIFDLLKKNYYLFVSNRTYIQYRWR